MQQMNILFLPLLGLILTVSCLFRDASAAAPAAKEKQGDFNGEVLLQELQRADGEAENAQEAEPPLVYTEETFEKLLDIANAGNSVFRRGKKTALAGVAALLFFLGIYLLQNYRKKTEEFESLFKKETGAITFTGIGVMFGAVTLGIGLGCMLGASKLKGGGEKRIMRLLGREVVEYGSTIMQLTSTAIVVGWFLSLPPFFMMAATADFLVGLTFVIVGLAYMISDTKKAISVAKQIYPSGDFVAEGKSKKIEEEGVEGEFKFINNVLEELKAFIAAEKARKSVGKSNEKIKETEAGNSDPLFILDEDALNALAQQLEGPQDASAQKQTAAFEKATSTGKEETTAEESESE